MSLGTVYRNLSLFKKEGNALSVAVVGGQERFDGCTQPHAHFICRCCGGVSDFGPMPDILAAEDGGGAMIEGCQLNYYGVCAECAKKKVHLS